MCHQYIYSHPSLPSDITHPYLPLTLSEELYSFFHVATLTWDELPIHIHENTSLYLRVSFKPLLCHGTTG